MINRYISFICLFLMLIGGCNKVAVDVGHYTATLQVVNAIPKFGENIKMNFTGEDVVYNKMRSLDYYYANGNYVNGCMPFSLEANKKVSLKVVLEKDTLQEIFTGELQPLKDYHYTLFLADEQPSGILLHDTLVASTDSLTHIRFVNLSPNAGNISINLVGNVSGSEVMSLPYKQATSFKSYPATSLVQDYLFEFHNAETDEVLGYFYYDNLARCGNVTLLIRGILYGGPEFEVVRLDH